MFLLMRLWTASDGIQFTVQRLDRDTWPGLVHRAAAESWWIRPRSSQRRGEWATDKFAIDGSAAAKTASAD